MTVAPTTPWWAVPNCDCSAAAIEGPEATGDQTPRSGSTSAAVIPLRSWAIPRQLAPSLSATTVMRQHNIHPHTTRSAQGRASSRTPLAPRRKTSLESPSVAPSTGRPPRRYPNSIALPPPSGLGLGSRVGRLALTSPMPPRKPCPSVRAHTSTRQLNHSHNPWLTDSGINPKSLQTGQQIVPEVTSPDPKAHLTTKCAEHTPSIHCLFP
jgi:hypothetical protein